MLSGNPSARQARGLRPVSASAAVAGSQVPGSSALERQSVSGHRPGRREAAPLRRGTRRGTDEEDTQNSPRQGERERVEDVCV